MNDLAHPVHAPFALGWEEWLALPDLGLPALCAKVDTGAKTSSLHAFDIEPFGAARAPHVRFAVHGAERHNSRHHSGHNAKHHDQGGALGGIFIF